MDLFETEIKRPNKGKNLIAFPDSYVLLDTETTGLDPEYDRIIEFAGIKVKDNEIIDKFQTLIKPPYEISSFITDFTGITNEMLKTAPALEEIFPEIEKFIKDEIIIAHNANFDINFLYESSLRLNGNGISNDFVDTMRLSRRIFPEEKHNRLCDLIERFSIGTNVEHRALSDVIQTNECYKYLKNYIAENNIDIVSLYPKKKHTVKATELCSEIQIEDINPDSSIYGKGFVFTGALDKMLRKDAMQIVLNMGGFCFDSVTKKTNYLVLGNGDYCSTVKDGKSSKYKKAEQLMLKGQDIQIISENVFYDMINE